MHRNGTALQQTGSVRILLADDHDIIRSGLRTLLGSQDGWEVVGEASTGREAVERARQLTPDVVVMDITMPTMNGLEATRRIKRLLPATEIVILSAHYCDELVQEAVAAGARAYVLKGDAEKDLVTAVQALAKHSSYFTSCAMGAFLETFRETNGSSETRKGAGERPTPREREIIQLLAEGKSTKEVAVSLNLSVKTAETHRANIMRKLGFHTVCDLVRYAVRHQIIEP